VQPPKKKTPARRLAIFDSVRPDLLAASQGRRRSPVWVSHRHGSCPEYGGILMTGARSGPWTRCRSVLSGTSRQPFASISRPRRSFSLGAGEADGGWARRWPPAVSDRWERPFSNPIRKNGSESFPPYPFYNDLYLMKSRHFGTQATGRHRWSILRPNSVATTCARPLVISKPERDAHFQHPTCATSQAICASCAGEYFTPAISEISMTCLQRRARLLDQIQKIKPGR